MRWLPGEALSTCRGDDAVEKRDDAAGVAIKTSSCLNFPVRPGVAADARNRSPVSKAELLEWTSGCLVGRNVVGKQGGRHSGGKAKQGRDHCRVLIAMMFIPQRVSGSSTGPASAT
jgi:hypothetical protein